MNSFHIKQTSKTQLNAMTSSASLQQPGTAPMQSQVILSPSQFNSPEDLPNGTTFEANEHIHFHTTSHLTESNNDQESIKQEGSDLEATNNETLEINLINYSNWVENEIETELSQPMHFVRETSQSNEIITSYDPVTAGTYYIINSSAEQTSEADAVEPNGTKSICLIQQTPATKVSSQITLPWLQWNYARAVLSDDKIQSTSNDSSTKSTFVRKISNKVIQSDVLIKSLKANVPAQSSNGRMESNEFLSETLKTQPGKPEVKPKNIALQSNLKASLMVKGNVRVHPYADEQKKSNESRQNPATSKSNPGMTPELETNATRPESSNTLINSNGSIKQVTLVAKSHLNFPLEDSTNFEVPKYYDIDRIMPKSNTKEVIKWDKVPQPLPRPNKNSDPKKTSSKRNLKENISQMTHKKILLEQQAEVKIKKTVSTFSLPQVPIRRIEMTGAVKQKMILTGNNLKSPLKPNSETLSKKNVGVFKLPSVDKVLANYIKILEKNNVIVFKVIKN